MVDLNLASVPGSRSREFFLIFIKTANKSRDTNFKNFLLLYSESTHETTPVHVISAKLGQLEFLMKISNDIHDFLTKN